MPRVSRVNLLLLSSPLANLRGVVVGVVCGEILVFGVPPRLARAEAAHLRARRALALLPVVGLRGLLSWVLRRRDRARRAKYRRRTHFPSA